MIFASDIMFGIGKLVNIYVSRGPHFFGNLFLFLFYFFIHSQIDELHREKKLPIIVGGTNYYIESLLWKFTLDTEV